MYLASLGCPSAICLQLGKPAVFAAGKGRGGMFLFPLFHHFHSFSSVSPVPLLSLLSLFSLALGDDTK